MRLRIVSAVLPFAALLSLAQIAPSGLAKNPPAYLASPPVGFEVNQGQTSPQVRFISRGKGYTAFLTAGGMTLALHANQRPVQSASVGASVSAASTSSAIQLKLVGANGNPAIVGENPLPGKANYFIGRDPAKWHTNVATYAQVRYKGVYPGIDLVYYGSHQRLEYDFVVSPGSDPGQIQFEVQGAKQTSLDAAGDLVLFTGTGEVHFQSPSIYQESNGTRVPVAGAYVLQDSNHVAFQVARYDSSAPLLIDPVLVYSTDLGGSGDDQPYGIAVDSAGDFYVAGYTDSIDFPLATLGTLPAGNTHVFVAKLDATGSNLIYADYVGGNNQDYGYALALDSADEVYVTGSTTSSDFPLVNPYQSTYPGSFNGFLSRLSADGSSLLYSTYLGGNGSDIPSAIELDSSRNVLVAGNTSSTNFPVVNAFQATANPNQGGLYGNYGFLTKFSPDGSSLVYSTYFAGSSNVAYNCGFPCWPSPYSAINAIALDTNGNAFVAGNTNTYDFPTTSGAYLASVSTQTQNAFAGFVSKFDGSGALDYSTYFYESSGSLTNVNAIAVDASGSAYITGAAFSDGTFPVTTTSICDPGVSGFSCGYAFVSKFNSSGSQLLYSTFLGLNNLADSRSIALDSNNDAYVLAYTTSTDFVPVNSIEQYSGGNDLLLVEIDPLGGSQLFATYIGASVDEFPSGLIVDAADNMYVLGTTDSNNFPTTQGAFQETLAGNTDAFIMKIAAGSGAAASMNPRTLEYAAQTIGSTSSAQTVLLRNMGSSTLAISSITNVGDFAETDNCAGSVASAGSCTLSVTFTPTAAGIRTGSISVNDNALGSPQVINLSGTANGAVANVTPASLTFSAQTVGSTSAAQAVILSNGGNETLNISTIQSTGDFTESNNCPSALTASSSCTINVTFTPTTSGVRTGLLTINDDAQPGSLTAALTGTGALPNTPAATLSPASLNFADQALTTSSAARAVTVTNGGTGILSITSISITGDYSQTNNCGSQLAAGSGCTVEVAFTPTVSGSRSGILTVNDNAAGSPQTATLTGKGSDFSVTGSPASTTVKAGSAAAYTLTVASTGGSFAVPVALACSGLPAQASCNFSPATVTPGVGSAQSNLSISTIAAVASAYSVQGSEKSPLYAVWLQMPGFGLFGVLLIQRKRNSKKIAIFAVLLLTMAALFFMTACAGGTGTVALPQTGTPAGSYSVTITATAGSLHHSLTTTLIVQ
jgi:hypothetical protein